MTILRQARTTGSFHPAQVIVDGEQVGELRDGGRLTLDLAPGTHVVEVGGGGLSRRLEISVIEGEVLRYKMHFSVWGALGGGLQLIPELESPQELRGHSMRTMIRLFVGLAVVAVAILIIAWPTITSHTVVYEGPCTYDALDALSSSMSGSNVALACGSRKAEISAYLTNSTGVPEGIVEVPCTIFADNHANCNFRAFLI